MIASALPYLPVLMPLFVFGAALEAYWLHKRGKSYPWAECASTLGVWLGQRANNTLVGGSVFAILLWFESFQSNPIFLTSVWDWLVLFVLMEFCYYWQHRLSHECRWFWATHSVHHSPNRMVLLGALRLGWTGSVTGIFLFFVPMVLIGYSVLDVLLVLGINLLYQFWLHTELVPKLGVLEWVFNTPSHHRVHHASNPQYIDRNYGGMLIVFDRLFGTFAEENEDEPLRYGLVKPVTTHNPIRIALNEWMQIGKELRYARTLSHIIQI